VTDIPVGAAGRTHVLFEDADHLCVRLGAADRTGEQGLDASPHLIVDGGEGLLLEPGSDHAFPEVFDAVTDILPPERLRRVFLSHPDPDVCSGLASWLEVRPDLELVLSHLWERFLPHLALPAPLRTRLLPDEGELLTLRSGSPLLWVPAHFLHSPGNFHVYDQRSRTLFTGDLGSSRVSEEDTELVVTDFAAHVPRMEDFHRRCLPCNRAVALYLERVRELPVDRVCPQHGKAMEGDDVGRFFDWLGGLDVGLDHRPWGD